MLSGNELQYEVDTGLHMSAYGVPSMAPTAPYSVQQSHSHNFHIQHSSSLPLSNAAYLSVEDIDLTPPSTAGGFSQSVYASPYSGTFTCSQPNSAQASPNMHPQMHIPHIPQASQHHHQRHHRQVYPPSPPSSQIGSTEYAYSTTSTPQQPVLDAQEARVAETIVRARKSWKTIKGRAEPVWPPELEKALVQGMYLVHRLLFFLFCFSHPFLSFFLSFVGKKRTWNETPIRNFPSCFLNLVSYGAFKFDYDVLWHRAYSNGGRKLRFSRSRARGAVISRTAPILLSNTIWGAWITVFIILYFRLFVYYPFLYHDIQGL